jgi:hypothetical protein
MLKQKSISKPLIITVLIAGTLAGLAARIMYYSQSGNDPLTVLRFIASGGFGVSAFSGGLPVASWGIVFHVIAFCWTILFFSLAARFPVLIKRWVIYGILYGIFVWLMMNLVVIPTSLVPMKTVGKE